MGKTALTVQAGGRAVLALSLTSPCGAARGEGHTLPVIGCAVCSWHLVLSAVTVPVGVLRWAGLVDEQPWKGLLGRRGGS